MLPSWSSARTTSAASFDTSVPVMPMATPTSACLSDGASLTPSPVIAVTCPRPCSDFTMRSLCSGDTRANTPMPSTRSVSWSSLHSSSVAPVTVSPRMPSSPAIAVAVVGWSPVIIFTAMPAPWARAMASPASARGGSARPMSPTSSRSLTSSTSAAWSAPSIAVRFTVVVQIASTRRPWRAAPSTPASTRLRHPLSKSTVPAGVAIVVQRSASRSTAPFTAIWTRSGSSVGTMVAMNLRPESNGTSARRRRRSRSAGTSTPRCAARRTTPISVGSPTSEPSVPSPMVTTASDASVATSRRRSAASRPSPDAVPSAEVATSMRSPANCTSTADIRFMVRVPVLSEQITDVDPSVSTLERFLTIAPCFAT